MKKTDLQRLFIQGEMDEVISKVDYILQHPLKYSNDSSKIQSAHDILNLVPRGGYHRLAFYSLKHHRFDILDHFSYTNIREDEIRALGRHLGGKYQRYQKWFAAFEKSQFKNNINSEFESEVIKHLVNRSQGLYEMETILNIIEDFPHTREKYIEYFKGRTSEKGIQFFTKLDRSNKLDKILNNE